MIIIREERPEDVEAIRRVNNEAFGQPAEAEVVDRLRESCKDLLSIVAVEGGEVMGHILFSPASIGEEGATPPVAGMGLAPMAVLPERQGQGIGSLLIHTGIKIGAPPSSSLLDTRSTTPASASRGRPGTGSTASGRRFPTRRS